MRLENIHRVASQTRVLTTGMLSAVLFCAACQQSAVAPDTSAASPPRLPDRPLTLEVTQVAPGELAGFRIVGGFASTDVTILRGASGTCPPPLDGTCVDLEHQRVVGTAPTDAAGTVLLELEMPETIRVGNAAIFQAVTTDAAGTSYVSNVVERTIQSPAEIKSRRATNILVLLIDDVGVDRFALYGATHPATTPVIDSLAADGVLFENAWAMPWCAPTRAALQTGRYPRRTGYGENPSVLNGEIELDPNLVTLAELVEYSPFFTYDTSYVGKWHLSAFTSPSGTLGPIVQGWDWWSGSMANVYGWSGPEPHEPADYFHWQKIDTTGVMTMRDVYATTDNVDDAVDRVAAMGEPWMMQVSFNSAHSPFHVPPAGLYSDTGLTDDSTIPDKHRAMLEAADTEIGRLLDGIAPDVLERTTIFLLADNGTPDDALRGEEPDWDESKGSVFDGGVRIPFIVSGPLVGAPGSRSDTFADVVDVFPTIAQIAGVDTSVLRGSLDPTSPDQLDGFSLVPALEDPTAPTGRGMLYTERFKPGGAGPFSVDLRAIRNANYKLQLDAVCERELFFEYVDGADDEGENLLEGALTPEQQAALDQLRAEMDALVSGLTYDAATWPPSPLPGGCPDGAGDGGES